MVLIDINLSYGDCFPIGHTSRRAMVLLVSCQGHRHDLISGGGLKFCLLYNERLSRGGYINPLYKRTNLGGGG